MSFFLQIFLGFLPGTVLFAILTFVQKKHKLRNISALVCFCLISAAAISCNFSVVPHKAETELKNGESKLQFLYAVAAGDDTDLAENLLKEYRSSEDDCFEATLIDSYLHACRGDVLGAVTLYSKAAPELDTYDKDYSELCLKALEAMKNGETSKAAEKLGKEARRLISELAEKNCTESFSDAASLLGKADELYSDYLTNGVPDAGRAESLSKKITSLCESEPDVASIPSVRKAVMKLSVLSGNYRGAALALSDNASPDELLIVSELYINGLVKDSSFSDGFGEEYINEYKRVVECLEKVREKIAKDRAEYRVACDLEDELNRAIESPAAYHMMKMLSDVANDETSTDAPKASLQLARIEHKAGYSSRAEGYLTDSLTSIGLCDDDSFTRPATEIIGAISDKDDPERLKHVAENVEALVENTSDEVVYRAVTGAAEPTEDDGTSFTSFATDYSSHKRASLNISRIDTSDFETIRATVNVDTGVSLTADELKEKIKLVDCGHEIKDFTVEKVDYKGANILLCCDVSGSMDGTPIASLRSAVIEFINTSSDIENIALVPFNDGVGDFYSFGTPDSEILDAASNLYAGGGTDMYDALIFSHDEFTVRNGEVNMVLLLSDGEDNYERSETDINAYIGAPYTSDGIVIYSLGLGYNVNAEYMQTLASSTGGTYQYVMDDATLDSFYTRLRDQILNQYVITFEAENTITMNGRELTVSLTEDSMCSDTEIYSIGDELDPDGMERASVISMQNRSVSGFDTRRIYRSSSPVRVNMCGTGFEESDAFTLRLEGNLSYSAKCEYVSDTCVSVTIPAGIACGTYDVVFTVNSGKAILDDELIVIAPGTEKATCFGPYVFTSCSKSVVGNVTTLSGYVNLNGWLTFNGDVILTGDLSSYEIMLTDHSGSYIRYYSDTAEGGYAKMLAGSNHALSVPALGTVRLFNDPNADSSSDEYTSEYSFAPTMFLANVAEIQSPGVALLPRMITVKSDAFTTKLPFQDNLMKSSGLEPLFSFDASLTGKITATKVGVRAEASVGDNRKDYIPVNFGSMPIYLSKGSCKLKLDTEKNEYEIELGTKVAFIDSEGLSLRIAWNDKAGGAASLFPSTIEIGSDTKIDSFIGTVPVTYHDFKLCFDDINVKELWKIKLVGSFDLDFAQLHDFLPGISEWLGDPSLFKLDDVTATLALGDMYISVEAKAKLLDAIELGHAKIEAGKLSYSNVLLDMKNETSYGYRAELGVGVKWKTDNCDIDVGAKGELSLHSKFIGCEVDGDCHIDVRWWVVEKDFNANGKALIGVYRDHSDRATFVVKSRGTDKKGTTECYIVWNSDNFDVGVKKL